MNDLQPAGAARAATPLCDNVEHIERLRGLLDLGDDAISLSRVSGGFHHTMWRLQAGQSCYAVKQIADDVDIGDSPTRTRLNATEAAAREFARRGIPALASLCFDGEHLLVLDDTGYFVFPWTACRARGRNAIEPYHAETVAGILARMHRADLQVPGLAQPVTWPLTQQRVTDLLALARQRNVHEVSYMQARVDDILAVVERHEAARAILSRNRVVSHGDLDHKNVLWSEQGEPLIIDWESARPINPTYELLLEALDWSGITAHFDHAPFEHFLAVYVQAGGGLSADCVPAAFDAILGAWVNWMLYNVGRAAGIEDLRQRAVGTEQVDVAVSALLRLEKQLPRLTDIALAHAAPERAGV